MKEFFMPHVRPGCAAVALALFAFSVHAQPVDDSDAVVVTASRTQQRMRDAIPHTTVLTRSDIRQSQAVDLPTLLRREAGFEFTQTGGIGATSSTFLRGVATNQVLVLVDGVRVSSLSAGTTQIDQLMLDQIERVEIVRGNVSSLYGSGAIGGVIQVFTRRGEGRPQASVEAGIGGDHTRRLRAGISGELGDTRFSLNVSDFATRGFSAQDPSTSRTVNPDRDGYHNLSVSGSLSQRFGKDHEAGARFLSTRGDVQYDNAFAAAVTDRHNADANLNSFTLYSNNRLAARWFSRLSYSEGEDAYDGHTNGANTSRVRSGNRQLGWQNDIQVADEQMLSLGLEQQRQTIRSTTAYTRPGRRVAAVYAGYNGRYGRHALQVSARNEDFSDFGGAQTWFAGYGFDLSESVRLTVSSGTGFRAPTFNEMFFPGFGNASLRPERSRSLEAGVQYAAGPQLLRVAAFQMRVSDLINPFPVFNINNATIDGVEASFRGTLAGADVRASLTVQEPIQHTAAAHQQLIRRSKIFGSASIAKNVGDWRLGAELQASDRRYDNHVITSARVVLASYQVLNLTARYQLSRRSFLAARLDNALDRNYVLTHSYNTQGRKLSVSFSHDF